MTLDPRRPIRSQAYSWVVCGRLGNAAVPHVFIAGRASWLLDKEKMRYAETELAVVQTVPGGSIDAFLEHLYQFEARVKAKLPANIILLADVSVSLEVVPAIWRKTPDAIPVQILSGYQDQWSFPLRVCGRSALLSKLQLAINDKKLVSSLPDKTDDPNLWDWSQVRSALSSTTNRPPKLDEDSITNDELIDEAIVLCVASLPWWSDIDVPSVYDDIPVRIRSMGK